MASANSGVTRRGEEEEADEMGGGHEGGRRDRGRETDELNYEPTCGAHQTVGWGDIDGAVLRSSCTGYRVAVFAALEV